MSLSSIGISNYNTLKDTSTGLDIDPVDVTQFTAPNISTVPTPVTIPNSALTTKVLNGTGIFDELMTAITAQLTEQYAQGRLTEDTFGEVYATSLTQAMQIGVQFLMSREQTYLNNILITEQIKQAKLNEVILKTNLEKSKLEIHTAYLQAQLVNAQLAETKAQLGVLDAQYENLLKDNEIKNLEITATIPKQSLILDSQKVGIDKDNLLKDKQVLLTQEQIDTAILNQTSITKDNLIKDKNVLLVQEQIDTSIANQTQITKNNLLIDKQILLTNQQIESERAKTENTTTDGGAIGGLLGKDIALKTTQIALYTRQTNAFTEDFSFKVASMFKDVYGINKTSDSDLIPPTQFTNPEINEVITKIRTTAGLT
jgi:hypothetical protein